MYLIVEEAKFLWAGLLDDQDCPEDLKTGATTPNNKDDETELKLADGETVVDSDDESVAALIPASPSDNDEEEINEYILWREAMDARVPWSCLRKLNRISLLLDKTNGEIAKHVTVAEMEDVRQSFELVAKNLKNKINATNRWNKFWEEKRSR